MLQFILVLLFCDVGSASPITETKYCDHIEVNIVYPEIRHQFDAKVNIAAAPIFKQAVYWKYFPSRQKMHCVGYRILDGDMPYAQGNMFVDTFMATSSNGQCCTIRRVVAPSMSVTTTHMDSELLAKKEDPHPPQLFESRSARAVNK